MSKPTIYLHIGFHKTGTTAIQSFMAANAKLMQKKGVLYPNSGRIGNSHFQLANAIKKSNVSLDPVQLYDDLVQEMKKKRCDKLVISSECFMENIDPKVVHDWMSKTDADLKLVIYLRRQDLWLQSLYNEVVRDPSRRYTGSIVRMREVRTGMADYYDVLQSWADSFGKESIVVRVLEREQLSQGLYHDFSETIGVAYDEAFWVPERNNELNIGFSELLIMFLRQLNYIAMTRDMYNRIVDTLGQVAKDPQYSKKGEYALVTREESRALLGKYTEGNEMIAREYLNRQDGRLYYSEISADENQQVRLSGEIEKEIFDKLPEDIREHCIKMRPRLGKPLMEGRPFFAPAPATEEGRLRMINQRMRLELNWLYEEREQFRAD